MKYNFGTTQPNMNFLYNLTVEAVKIEILFANFRQGRPILRARREDENSRDAGKKIEAVGGNK